MIGVKFPFSLTSGSVTVTDNPTEIIGSQVTFLLGTMIGERVMRPSWGVDILSTVYSMGGEMDVAMQEAVENAFRTHFPDYEAREVSIHRNPDTPTIVEIEVRFGKYNSDLDQTVRVGTQLPSGTEIYSNEVI